MSAGNILAGFISGTAKSAAGQMEDRDKAEREMRKAKMLEQLRVETEKEITLFRESRPEYKLELEGKRLRNEADSEKLKQDREFFPIELETKKFGLDAAREDQQMQRERLAMERASHSESIAASREGRAAARRAASLDGSKDRSPSGKDILFREYEDLYKAVKDSGANEFELMNLEARWKQGVNQDKWRPQDQRLFMNRVYQSYRRKTRVQNAQGTLPSQVKAKPETDW